MIKEFEGIYLNAYMDPSNTPTIGWGTITYPDGTKVKMGDVCTAKQAEDWLMFEIESDILNPLSDMVKVPITDNERSALISFCYNLGVGSLRNSTMLKLLNEGFPRVTVASEFSRWINAGGRPLKGLIRRREAERKLFLT